MKQFFKNKSLTELQQSLNNFKSFVAKANGKNLDSDSLKKIKEFWKTNLEFFPFLCMPHEIGSESRFYRVRIEDETINRTIIQEFSTPPVIFSKSFQRANIPGYPVFYASLSMDVSVFEIFYYNTEKINSGFYISEWKIKSPLETIVTPFLFKENINSDLKDVVSPLEKKIAHLYENLNEDEKTFMLCYFEFIIKEFVNPESYFLSSYTAHNHIYAPHNYSTNMFFYPSVKKKHHGINVAIHPNFAYKNLLLEKVYYCKLQDQTLESMQVTFLQVGEVKENKILWRNFTGEDMKLVTNSFKSQNDNKIENYEIR